MNVSEKFAHPKRSLKPIAVALALASSAAFAASMGDVVKTRADQNIDQQYGRDSVYAFSPDSKPLSPERTWASHQFNQSQEQTSGLSDSQSQAASEVSDSQPAMESGSGYTDSDAM